MALTRVTYMSRPTASGEQDLITDQGDIIHKARSNNIRDGLTGSLLANENWFVQVLEGPSIQVMKTLNRILVDTRHKDTLLFEVAVVSDRMFENWSMHHSSLDDVEPALVWSCVDSFRQGSISGGRKAIHILTQAAEQSTGRIAQ